MYNFSCGWGYRQNEIVADNAIVGSVEVRFRGTDQDILLAIRGLSYPDIDFDGLVEMVLST